MNSQTITGKSQVYLSISFRKPIALLKALDIFSHHCENPLFVHQLTMAQFLFQLCFGIKFMTNYTFFFFFWLTLSQCTVQTIEEKKKKG